MQYIGTQNIMEDEEENKEDRKRPAAASGGKTSNSSKRRRLGETGEEYSSSSDNVNCNNEKQGKTNENSGFEFQSFFDVYRDIGGNSRQQFGLREEATQQEPATTVESSNNDGQAAAMIMGQRANVLFQRHLNHQRQSFNEQNQIIDPSQLMLGGGVAAAAAAAAAAHASANEAISRQHDRAAAMLIGQRANMLAKLDANFNRRVNLQGQQNIDALMLSSAGSYRHHLIPPTGGGASLTNQQQRVIQGMHAYSNVHAQLRGSGINQMNPLLPNMLLSHTTSRLRNATPTGMIANFNPGEDAAAAPTTTVVTGSPTINSVSLPHDKAEEASQQQLGNRETDVLGEHLSPLVLYMTCDDDSLSDYQCLVRKQIEIFEAQPEDVESNAQGRNKPIVIGQVGIRCRHCSMLPPRQRARGAIYYPAKLDGLYQAAQNMASCHFCKHCKHIPDDIRAELSILRERKSSAGGGKKYWGDSVSVLGVYEDGVILRFGKRR